VDGDPTYICVHYEYAQCTLCIPPSHKPSVFSRAFCFELKPAKRDALCFILDAAAPTLLTLSLSFSYPYTTNFLDPYTPHFPLLTELTIGKRFGAAY